MVKQTNIIKETEVIFKWECPICKSQGREFKLRSMYETQIQSWIDSHNKTHEEG